MKKAQRTKRENGTKANKSCPKLFLFMTSQQKWVYWTELRISHWTPVANKPLYYPNPSNSRSIVFRYISTEFWVYFEVVVLLLLLIFLWWSPRRLLLELRCWGCCGGGVRWHKYWKLRFHSFLSFLVWEFTRLLSRTRSTINPIQQTRRYTISQPTDRLIDKLTDWRRMMPCSYPDRHPASQTFGTLTQKQAKNSNNFSHCRKFRIIFAQRSQWPFFISIALVVVIITQISKEI